MRLPLHLRLDGSKPMAKAPNPVPARAAEALLADLESLGPITKRAMFGGYGLFIEGTMFAIVDTQGTEYLRVDDLTEDQFAAAACQAHGAMPYWTIPPRVRSTHADLLAWAADAISAARRAKK